MAKPSRDEEYLSTLRHIHAARLAAMIYTTVDERSLLESDKGGRQYQKLYRVVSELLPKLGEDKVSIFVGEAYPAILELQIARLRGGVREAEAEPIRLSQVAPSPPSDPCNSIGPQQSAKTRSAQTLPTKKLHRALKSSKASVKITWANGIRQKPGTYTKPGTQAKPGAEAEPKAKVKPGAEAKLDAKAKLTALVDAAQNLANAWSALEEDLPLRRSVEDHLVGCLGVTSWRSSIPGEWDAATRTCHLAFIKEKYETKLQNLAVYKRRSSVSGRRHK